ncbi:MAG: HupE/UreJ family protein [Vulcanococcus sp.]
MSPRFQGSALQMPKAAAAALALAALPLWAAPSSAHHLMGLFHQTQVTPLAGLLSGIGHPLLGPDHLLFLLALGLVGLQQSGRWMIALLATGLAATGVGLLLPGLPGAETLVALSLVLVGLVLCGRLPRWTLLPAFALHGYVLSASVIGWEVTPVATYLLGLLLSQGTLLVLALRLVRAWGAGLALPQLRLCAGLLIGIGGAFAWTTLVP